jgi:hypothetical protein
MLTSSSIRVCAITLAAMLAACATTATPGPIIAESVNDEGLATVRSRNFDKVQIRLDTDFSSYSRVMLLEPELDYRPVALDRPEPPLTEEQDERLRAALSTAFTEELGGLESLKLADTPGPGTIAARVEVRDIVVSTAPQSVGRIGRSAALLEASAEAVVVIELRDSLSNEILARGTGAGAASGGALRTPEGELRTRFDAPDKVVRKWAKSARAGLQNLLNERR